MRNNIYIELASIQCGRNFQLYLGSTHSIKTFTKKKKKEQYSLFLFIFGSNSYELTIYIYIRKLGLSFIFFKFTKGTLQLNINGVRRGRNVVTTYKYLELIQCYLGALLVAFSREF